MGVTTTLSPPRFASFEAWLNQGFHGSMKYLTERREAYRSAESVLEGCRSIVMLGMPYSKSNQPIDGAEPEGSKAVHQGKVARYASGKVDYHDLIHARLRGLVSWIRSRHPEARVRGVVDTAPILEREFAQLSGIGWIGKNTLLLTKTHGSYFFLAAILTDLPLTSDGSFATDHCGTCRACLDACPTQAFPQPYVLDAGRCISYLTIEHRGAINTELQASMSEWVFGCDVCQEVCPWNRKPNPVVEEDLAAIPENSSHGILELLSLSPESFRSRFRKTPLWRSKWEGLIRNAAIVAGNLKLQEARPHLNTLALHPMDSIRSAAESALKRLDGG